MLKLVETPSNILKLVFGIGSAAFSARVWSAYVLKFLDSGQQPQAKMFARH